MTIEFKPEKRKLHGNKTDYNVTCHSCMKSQVLQREGLESFPKFLGAKVTDLSRAWGLAEKHDIKYEGSHVIKIREIVRGRGE